MYAKTHNNVFIRIQILDLKLPFGSSTVASKPYHSLSEFLKNFYLVLLSLKTITISSFHLSIGHQRKVVSVKVKNWRQNGRLEGNLDFLGNLLFWPLPRPAIFQAGFLSWNYLAPVHLQNGRFKSTIKVSGLFYEHNCFYM